MSTVATIGLDIAMAVFQVHDIGARGEVTDALRARLAEFGRWRR
jgi:hypothetical protein